MRRHDERHSRGSKFCRPLNKHTTSPTTLMRSTRVLDAYNAMKINSVRHVERESEELKEGCVLERRQEETDDSTTKTPSFYLTFLDLALLTRSHFFKIRTS